MKTPVPQLPTDDRSHSIPRLEWHSHLHRAIRSFRSQQERKSLHMRSLFTITSISATLARLRWKADWLVDDHAIRTYFGLKTIVEDEQALY
ncbi:hypothetical protein ACHAWT_009936 [Skeletonema menzelii]